MVNAGNIIDYAIFNFFLRFFNIYVEKNGNLVLKFLAKQKNKKKLTNGIIIELIANFQKKSDEANMSNKTVEKK